MTITLRPEQEKEINEAIESGAYQDADEVIARALEMLREEDRRLRLQREEIDAKIDVAIEQFERGEFFTEEESKADMERRKAEWLNEQKR